MHNPASGEQHTQTPMGLTYIALPILGQKTRPFSYEQKKKRICKIRGFAVPADHRIKLKESEKMDKYRDRVRELKNYGT